MRVLKSFDRMGLVRPRFSPDGRFIAYDFSQEPDSTARDIGVFAVDGSGETAVVRHPADDVIFDWTPDGKRLLFGSDRSGTMGAWWIQVADGQPVGAPELVKAGPGTGRAASGLHAGRLVLLRGRTGMSDVYIAELDLVSGRVLAPPILATQRFAGSNSRPDWSSDGRQLAFLSHRGPGEWGARAICVRDYDERRGARDSFEAREGGRASAGSRTTVPFWPRRTESRAAGSVRSGLRCGTATSSPVDLTQPVPLGHQGGLVPDRQDDLLPAVERLGAGVSSIVARDVASGQEKGTPPRRRAFRLPVRG